MAPNDQRDDGIDRRKFLAGTAGASLSPFVIGSASADQQRDEQ